MTDPKREAVLTTALLVVGTFVLGGALTTIVIKRTDPNWLESIGTLLAAAAAVYAAVLIRKWIGEWAGRRRPA